jgi:hypothetical protein
MSRRHLAITTMATKPNNAHFHRLPKALSACDRYKSLSDGAKILHGHSFIG